MIWSAKVANRLAEREAGRDPEGFSAQGRRIDFSRDGSLEMLHQPPVSLVERRPQPSEALSGKQGDANRAAGQPRERPSPTITQHWTSRSSYILPISDPLGAHSIAMAEIPQTICLPSLDNLNSCEQFVRDRS